MRWHLVAGENLIQGFGATYNFRLSTMDQHGGWPRDRIEVAGRDLLIGAGIQNGDHIPYLQRCGSDSRQQSITITAPADNIHDFGSLSGSVVGDQVFVQVVLVTAAGKPEFGGVGGHQFPANRALELFDRLDRGQMNAAVAKQRATGFHLQHDAAGIHCVPMKLIAEGSGSRPGIFVDGGSRLGVGGRDDAIQETSHPAVTDGRADPVEPARHAMEPLEQSRQFIVGGGLKGRRRGEPATDVDLHRLQTAQGSTQLGHVAGIGRICDSQYRASR